MGIIGVVWYPIVAKLGAKGLLLTLGTLLIAARKPRDSGSHGSKRADRTG